MSPAEDADCADIAVYKDFCYTTSTIFIEIVSQVILEKMIQPEQPNLIRTWLHTKYLRDLGSPLVSHILNRVPHPTSYTDNNSLEVVEKVESEWLLQIKLSMPSSGLYCTSIEVVLTEEKAK